MVGTDHIKYPRKHFMPNIFPFANISFIYFSLLIPLNVTSRICSFERRKRAAAPKRRDRQDIVGHPTGDLAWEHWLF
jgi:hypothetical protein